MIGNKIFNLPLLKKDAYNAPFNRRNLMVRISKQEERRSVSRRRPAPPAKKTGPKKDALSLGFKLHPNALEGVNAFIPKIQ